MFSLIVSCAMLCDAGSELQCAELKARPTARLPLVVVLDLLACSTCFERRWGGGGGMAGKEEQHNADLRQWECDFILDTGGAKKGGWSCWD